MLKKSEWYIISNKETISENMVVALVMAVQEENEQIEAREK